MFDTTLLLRGLSQGVVVLVAALAMFQLGIHDSHGEDTARATAFTTLVLGNLGLVLTNRSLSAGVLTVLRRPNAALALVVGVTLPALALTLAVPLLRGLFGFAALNLSHLSEAAAAAIVTIVVNGGLRLLWNRAR